MNARRFCLFAVLLWAACSEEIPPVAPQQTGKPDPDRPPPQEIDDPSPGGGGGGQINYLWVPLPEVKLNYGGAPLTDEGKRLKDYVLDTMAPADTEFVWDIGSPPAGREKWVPVLVYQDSEADQLCLAYAIYYGCDPGADSKYYHEAWHAIRTMMYRWYTMAGFPPSWCNNGWIGMARNLLPYLVAADYLNSLGPIGTVGYGGFNNQQTFDSLRCFVMQIRDADPLVTAPGNEPCLSRSKNLRDMCWPQEEDPNLGSPDNKGAAALASYLGAAIFSKNRGGSLECPYVASELYESAQRWYRAWYDHTQGHFNDHRFENHTNWPDTWVQVDGILGHPQPILSAGAGPRQWPYPCTGSPPDCFTWTSMSGTPTDDLIRGGGTGGQILGKPSQIVQEVPHTTPLALKYDDHVSGTTNYLVNAAELLYQDGIPWADQFGWATNGPWRTAQWHDYYALVQSEFWPEGRTWPELKHGQDDWPCTYILHDRGFSIEPGRLHADPREGKQMGLTDLTHK